MKKLKFLAIIMLLICLATPTVSFAAWWNPLSWFETQIETKSEIVAEISTEISSSNLPMIAEIKTAFQWWNPFSWAKNEQKQEQEHKLKQELAKTKSGEVEPPQVAEKVSEKTEEATKQAKYETETAHAKAEAEKYKLEAEKTRLEIEKLKQENTTKIQTETKKEESKNTTVTLPNGAIIEMDEYGNIVRTIKEAPVKPSEPTQTTQPIQPINNIYTGQLSVNDLYFEQTKSQISYYQKIISDWQEKYQNRKKLSQDGIQICNDIYDNRIQWAKEDGDEELMIATEKRGGVGINQYALDSIKNQTERKITELEYEKTICIAKYGINNSIPSELSKLLDELSVIENKLNKNNSIVLLNEVELIGTRIIYTISSLGN